MLVPNPGFEIPKPETRKAVDAVIAFAETHQLDPNAVAAFVAQIGHIIVPPEAAIEERRRITGRAISDHSPVHSPADARYVQDEVAALHRTYDGAKLLGHAVLETTKDVAADVADLVAQKTAQTTTELGAPSSQEASALGGHEIMPPPAVIQRGNMHAA